MKLWPWSHLKYELQTCDWRHVNEQECILRKTSEYSWASLAHCWKPLEYSVCWLDWGEGELRVHVWKDHSCCIQQLLSGTTCFSREPRPTEKGRQLHRHNPRQCMSAICPACCGDQCSRERMTPVLGLRQRDTVMSGCTLADSSADARPGQTLATED